MQEDKKKGLDVMYMYIKLVQQCTVHCKLDYVHCTCVHVYNIQFILVLHTV